MTYKTSDTSNKNEHGNGNERRKASPVVSFEMKLKFGEIRK